MTPRLVFRPEARQEALEAEAWYEERAPGLGLEFTRALGAALAAVQRTPEAFPRVSGDVRRAVLRRFPYGIVFARESDDLVVLAVHHHRRDPRRWLRRT